MTISRYFLWIALTLLWFVLLSAAQIPVRKRRNMPVRAALAVVKPLLGSLIAFWIIAIDSDCAYKLGFFLAPLYVVLFGDAAGDVVLLLAGTAKKTVRVTNRPQIAVCAVCTVLFLAFGTVNMQTVHANRLTVHSEKLTRAYRVVFLSDLHVGSAQSMSTVEKTVRGLDSENADCVLLGGDIVDEYTAREEMEHVFSLFGTLRTPVYFLYGNHDRQPSPAAAGGRTFTDAELEAALLSNGITVLRDEWVSFADDLEIFGREDAGSDERKPLSGIAERPENAFVLAVDHSPYEREEIIESGADLQLSGHTHAGLLFPLRLVYDLAGYDACGFYRHGNTDLYVSSGVSGWLFPLRTEAGCHYEVITLQPEG